MKNDYERKLAKTTKELSFEIKRSLDYQDRLKYTQEEFRKLESRLSQANRDFEALRLEN